jgi:hypothetical protein
VKTLVRMYRLPFRAMNSSLSSSNIGCPGSGHHVVALGYLVLNRPSAIGKASKH